MTPNFTEQQSMFAAGKGGIKQEKFCKENVLIPEEDLKFLFDVALFCADKTHSFVYYSLWLFALTARSPV